MSRINLAAIFAVAILTGAANGSQPALTAGSPPEGRRTAGAPESPASVCWYNGDLDYRGGLTSDRNTAVVESWTFDDVNWEGGTVTGFRAHFIIDSGTVITAADLIIYQGLGEGTFGTLIADRPDITDYTFTRTGNNAFGRDEYLLVANLGADAFHLAPGDYHVGIRFVGNGSGQTFVLVTSGANAVGSPPGNNGRSYLQSNFFGYPLPTDWQNLKGPGRWDVSYGLECRPSAYTVSLSGQCPGRVRLEWSGAEPDRRQGILFAFETGNYTIPTGLCNGTELGLGTNNLRLYHVLGTGNGSGAINGNTGYQCRGYVQLITVPSCATSNVAQVP